MMMVGKGMVGVAHSTFGISLFAMVLILGGCQSTQQAAPATQPAAPTAAAEPATPAAPAQPAAPAAPAVAPAPVAALPTIRIKTGVDKPCTDAEGNVWLPDQ